VRVLSRPPRGSRALRELRDSSETFRPATGSGAAIHVQSAYAREIGFEMFQRVEQAYFAALSLLIDLLVWVVIEEH
jgi:hypothetical protein